jgi:hypothetical protein
VGAEGGTIRPVTPVMRAVFIVGSVLVSLAGTQLFVLTDHTDRYFAWTIGVPITAGFLGAFYFTALALAFQSWLQSAWANARVVVPGVFVFLVLTLVTTFLHLSAFHFHDPSRFARAAAWLWLVIYAADPAFIAVAWVLQRRARGIDPPRTQPLPGWYLGALSVHAAILVGVGVALFVAPSTSTSLWPWPLTPLTARAVASWLIGNGLVVVCAIVERDFRRIRPATAAYVALGVLQFVVIARYGSTVDWGSPRAWIYVAFLASAIALGTYGWLQPRRA